MTWTTRKAEAFVRAWKQSHACVDCSLKSNSPVFYPYYQLEFDHIGPKRWTLGHSREIRKLTEDELRREIAMTDLVCRNCHAEREYRRKQARKNARSLNQFAEIRHR